MNKIYILGDAPNLDAFSTEITRLSKDSLIICLNKSIFRYKNLKENYNLIHFFADHRFVEANELGYNTKVIYPIALKEKCDLNFRTEILYNPVWRIDQEYEGTLRAGRSVLIPALHYAMLQRPAEIIIYGVQLKTRDHWYKCSGNVEAKFPGWMYILKDFYEVLKAFKDSGTRVISGNRDSLLVDYKIIKTREQEKLNKGSNGFDEPTYYLREWAEFVEDYQARLEERKMQQQANVCLGH